MMKVSIDKLVVLMIFVAFVDPACMPRGPEIPPKVPVTPPPSEPPSRAPSLDEVVLQKVAYKNARHISSSVPSPQTSGIVGALPPSTDDPALSKRH